MHSFMEILFPLESSHIEDYNYIIEPICLVGKLKQASKIEGKDEAKLKLNIEVDNFSVKLYKDQYDNICRLAEVGSDYQRFQMLYYATKRFKYLRPVYGVNSVKTEGKLTGDHVTNENAVLWWKYAINCVIKVQREKKGSFHEFKIPKDKKREYEVNFMKQFQKYLLNEEYNKEELHHIILAVDQEDLEKWVTVITKKRIDQENKKKENEGGWFGFFRQKRVEEELKDDEDNNISPEEIEEVYKTLHDKFLKNDDIEEVKEASDIINIEAELVVKRGGLNLIYKKTNMNMYFTD